MATHHQPFDDRDPLDDRDDAKLKQVLRDGYANTPPSQEFQEALLRQLDDEFASTYLHSEVPQRNGVASNVEATLDADSSPRSASAMRDRNRKRFVSLKLAFTMATAASLLLITALWNTQNAYGWASMLRALESCDWVQAVASNNGLRGWVSSQRNVLAIRDGEQVAFHDGRQQMSAQYLADHDVVYEQAWRSQSARASAGEQLFALLLANEPGAATSGLDGYQVVAESWERAAGDEADASRDTVELRVTLRGSDAKRTAHKLLIVVDAETHLPQSCRLITNKDSAKSLQFSYPDEGPNSIFALGVPRETEVIASLAKIKVRSEDHARDAESIRMAARSPSNSEQRLSARRRSLAESTGPLADRTSTSPEATKDETTIQASATQQAKNELNKPATQIVELGDGKPIVADEIITPKRENPGREDLAGGEAVAAAEIEQRVAARPQLTPRELPAIEFASQLTPLADLVEQVDAKLQGNWQQQGIRVAEPASDTEFLRRVYLDLTGRIPVPFEVYEYLQADPTNRREQLVEQLLDSRDHATHLATVWRKLLLPDGVDTNIYGGTGKFDEWLADRFDKNVPYDELVRQLLLAEGRVSDSGPILFYAALKLNPEELAAKTARTFLGMRMECAQCHDDKFDDSLTQEDFWGFAAYFAQISRPKGKIEMTSSVLRVRDNSRGEVTLPDSDEVVSPQLPYQVAMLDTAKPATEQEQRLSRREQLVQWLTTKQNRRFARATVNRVWQHLFGLGLVEPADDMRADNEATHPEVLELLSHDFAASNYDLRRLLRTLVLSDAYQLSSRASADEPSQSLSFARMNIKSFSADQLYDCINVATEPDAAGADDRGDGALARFGNTARQAFIEQFQAPPGQRTDYHAGIPQALTLMHGRLIHGATDLASSGLLKSINAPFFTDEQRIETLFLSTLSRFPDDAEQETMLAHVKQASDEDQRLRAFGDILWALLNSAEFTFIH